MLWYGEVVMAALWLFAVVQLSLSTNVVDAFSASTVHRSAWTIGERLPRHPCCSLWRIGAASIVESSRLRRKTAVMSTAGNTAAATNTPPATKASFDVPSDQNVDYADAIVCGGGPAGLLTAIMLAQKQQHFPQNGDEGGSVSSSSNKQPRFPTIVVYDRLPTPPPRPDDDAAWTNVAKFYLIGLGGRGQAALAAFGLWSAVEAYCVHVVGRKDWAPGSDNKDYEGGTETIFGPERPAKTQVLPRDKLVGVLHQHIVEKWSDRIEVRFGRDVDPVDFAYGTEGAQALLRVTQCVPTTKGDDVCETDDTNAVQYTTAPLVVAADGTVRTMANAIEALDQTRYAAKNRLQRLLAGRPFRVHRYHDDNPRVYKTLPFRVPPHWRPDLNYSVRTSRLNFDALPANTDGDYCGVLLWKRGDPFARSHVDAAALRALLDDALPQFSRLVDDATVAAVATKPVSALPGFRYVGPRLHEGSACVLLGDAAHTVKPYFGLGANSALEDVEELSDALDAQTFATTTDAVHSFSRHRAREARTLVTVSRDLDRPGALGTLTFLIPIILDGIFAKLAPRLFLPNVISMLQRDNFTFRRLARRKRIDRAVQLTIVGAVLTGLTRGAMWGVQQLATLFGTRPPYVWSTLAGLLTAVSLVRSRRSPPSAA